MRTFAAMTQRQAEYVEVLLRERIIEGSSINMEVASKLSMKRYSEVSRFDASDMISALVSLPRRSVSYSGVFNVA